MEFVDLKSQYRSLKHEIDARIHRVLDHGQYIMGPEVRELEEELARYVGARHCITCASGTEALLMSLMALGVGPGDEVITVPFTFAASAEVIVLLGATPVFIDIEPDTCLMDASRIEEAITARTKAIMPVSLYGQVCDMDLINAIAKRNGGIPVIEDAAQSFGASYTGASGELRKSCHLSTLGCTSFFPSKPLGCYGDGGAAFTDDDALAKVLREIRVHGQEKRYHHVRIGLGGRMDTIQCAVVLAKLPRFDWEIARRREVADRYSGRIAGSCPRVVLPSVGHGRDCVWAQFTVQLDQRELVQRKLESAGVPTAVHYPRSLDLQPAFRGRCRPGKAPYSHHAAERVLSLPMSPYLGPSDLDSVVDALHAATAVEAAGA